MVPFLTPVNHIIGIVMDWLTKQGDSTSCSVCSRSPPWNESAWILEQFDFLRSRWFRCHSCTAIGIPTFISKLTLTTGKWFEPCRVFAISTATITKIPSTCFRVVGEVVDYIVIVEFVVIAPAITQPFWIGHITIHWDIWASLDLRISTLTIGGQYVEVALERLKPWSFQACF